jgi:hypothetical protein
MILQLTNLPRHYVVRIRHASYNSRQPCPSQRSTEHTVAFRSCSAGKKFPVLHDEANIHTLKSSCISQIVPAGTKGRGTTGGLFSLSSKVQRNVYDLRQVDLVGITGCVERRAMQQEMTWIKCRLGGLVFKFHGSNNRNSKSQYTNLLTNC